jgi:uncharacterized phage protein gp47/JayE
MNKSLVGFKRPEISDIYARMVADMNAQLPTIDPGLRYTLANILIKTFTGAISSIYGYADWASNQSNVLTCDDENLDLFGVIWDVARKSASKAVGTATITGTDGKSIPIETIFRTSTGLEFYTTTSETIASGTATLSIESIGYGADYNVEDATGLQIESAISKVASTAVVVSVNGGADIENDDDYRARILDRIQKTPHGGTYNDWKTWCLEVPGVTRAWSTAGPINPGSVAVRFCMDDTYSDGIPEAGDVAIVEAYLEDYRPVGCKLYVFAPVPETLNIEIDGLYPDSATTRAAVEAELDDMVKRTAEPGGTIYLSQIYSSIAAASGVSTFTLVTPTADVDASTTSHLTVLGTVTFT